VKSIYHMEKVKVTDKISKICWNSNDWHSPSGSQGKSTSAGAFEAKTGYGHEEWLFDRSRIINGYHYAFLQPLNLKSDKHVGKIYNISLFTITGGIKYFVGKIRNARCISKDESQEIFKIYKRRGWLKEMIGDIDKAGADPKAFKEETPPALFFNVKFKFEEVIRPDELEEISKEDNNITTHHCVLLSKKDNFKIAYASFEDENEGNLKNTMRRKRTYKADSSFDPYHDKLQNALCLLLRNDYKNEYRKIDIEKNRVDIKAKTLSGKWHYFEIKTDNPKLSIRNALGQIMEYSYWPEAERAEKLIIVSDNAPDPETKRYIAHIRKKFSLPVFYRSFDIEKNILSEDY